MLGLPQKSRWPGNYV